MNATSRMPSESGPIPLNLYRVSAPGTARVVSNTRLTPETCDDVRHIVVDLSGLDYRYLEGQSLGVLPPGEVSEGRAHKLRLYSIASSRSGDDGRGNTASICVKRVVYLDADTGEERRGVASNYLCDLEPGATIRVTGPAGRGFLLPDDPSSPLILVATGTGIAPFRAFLQGIEREYGGWTAPIWLFFGVRTTPDCLYMDELRGLAERLDVRLVTACSREQCTADGRRLYVQHLMGEAMPDLWSQLVEAPGHMYLCGLKGMERGISDAFRREATRRGLDWHDLESQLMDSGRLHVETY